jgi:hypothetical protein
VPERDQAGAVDHRALAVALFNHVWSLLDAPRRSLEQDDEMLHAAHASVHHWRLAGTAVNRLRGEWQCARVYAALGRAEPALHHARRCLELCAAHRDELEPFDEPFAHEALARAHAVAGDGEAVARHLEQARALADRIDDADDRDLLEADLDAVAAGRLGATRP